MSRILLAWELGGGAGHLASLHPVASALLKRGHQVTLAAQDLRAAAAFYAGLDMPVVAAPLSRGNYGGLAEPPLSYSEILMRYGYLDSPMLAGLVRGWRGLITLTGADVLVADHAPTALLAARGLPLRCMTFGNPFAVPPAVHPTPNMRPWLEVPVQRLLNSDAAVLATINRALPAGAPPLAAVHELFDRTTSVFVGLPELDPYGRREADCYLGLHVGRSGTTETQWPAGAGPRIFAYLRADYRYIDACLAALAACNARCLVHLADATEALMARHRGPGLAFSDTPVDIESAGAQCDLAVCHSGLGMVNAMLRAGRPLLLLPLQLEQFLLAGRVAALGAAQVINSEQAQPDFAAALTAMLGDPQYARSAQNLAARVAAASVGTITDRAIARIEALAAQARENT